MKLKNELQHVAQQLLEVRMVQVGVEPLEVIGVQPRRRGEVLEIRVCCVPGMQNRYQVWL